MKKRNLKTLPLYYVRQSRKWWKNVITGVMIHDDKIEDYLPETIQARDESIRAKRWDLNYD